MKIQNFFSKTLDIFEFLCNNDGMRKRRARLEVLKEILTEQEISSQEALLPILQNLGYDVTQATLSRDLKALKVNKISGAKGYILTLPYDNHLSEIDYARDFLRGYISVTLSNNIAVIKTHSGFTDIVANAIDTLMSDVVLGTIAGGDNCVFACLKASVTEELFFTSMEREIRGFKRDGTK